MRARLPKGMGGGAPANMNQIMQQAQKMQDDMARKQAELDERIFTATSGGGMVEVTFNGKRELQGLVIKPEIVDPTDVEMLCDIVSAAINQALKDIENISTEELGKITGGMNIPGMM